MPIQLKEHRTEFSYGWTGISSSADEDDPVGIGLAVLRLREGEIHDASSECESAYLLLSGQIEGTAGDATFGIERGSPFDDLPCGLHVAVGERINLTALRETELLVFSVDNPAHFAPRVLAAESVDERSWGAGQAGETFLCLVRTILDDVREAPSTCLVLGETIGLPGRWAGFPPRRHPQPRLHHYRFTHPQGYALVEAGDRALRVMGGDTLRIPPETPHAQVCAPGYGMYCAFALRQMEGARYAGDMLAEEHVWTTDPGAPLWLPRALSGRS